MYDFFLQLALFGSLGVVIYLLARAVPRVTDVPGSNHGSGKFDRMLSQLPLGEIDERLNTYFEKFLRGMKVGVLKFGNVLDDRLRRIKKVNSKNGEGKPDLFDKSSDEK